MSQEKEYLDKEEENILHTYNRYQIVLDHGKGVRRYDVEGKEYLYFAAGIGVQSLGYCNPEYTEALKTQADKLTHISNLYYSVPMMEAAEKARRASGLEKVFFTNSGTEAVEGALKVARKYSYTKYGPERYEIIAMNHSFHGRSMGALSVTGKEAYRTPFEPLVGGVRFADYNDLESVKAQITDKTCAIILETIQGEGGIYVASEEFLRGVRAICDEHDLLLILDEIQCGMGRTGYMFAWQDYGVEPDVMTVAKALGCGVPVGAFAVGKKAAEASLVPGDHGTTYGGNPLVCAAVSKVLDIYGDARLEKLKREEKRALGAPLSALAWGFAFMLVCQIIGVLADFPKHPTLTNTISEGFLVLGWVALWKPFETLLFDWRPSVERTKLHECLAAMPVVLRPLPATLKSRLTLDGF